MIVTTTERTTAKLERDLAQPHWLRAVLDDGDAGFLIENLEEIAYVNRTYALLLGYDSPEELLGRHLSMIVAYPDTTRLLDFSRLRVRQEPAPRNYEFEGRRRDTSAVRLHATVSASRLQESIVITTMVLPCEPQHAPACIDAKRPQNLSGRETEVMEMILAGKRMKEIAFDLGLSTKTVSTHRNRLLRKLNLTSNRDLFQYAVTHHLIDWR